MKKRITLIGLLVLVCALCLGVGYATVTGSAEAVLRTKLTPEELKLGFTDNSNLPVSLAAYTTDGSAINFSYSSLDQSMEVMSWGDNIDLYEYFDYADKLTFNVSTKGTADKLFYVTIPVINLSKDLDAKNININMTTASQDTACGTPLMANGTLYGSIDRGVANSANTILDIHYTLTNSSLPSSYNFEGRTFTPVSSDFILRTFNLAVDGRYYGSNDKTIDTSLGLNGEGYVTYLIAEFYVTHSVDTDVTCSYNVSISGDSLVKYGNN